jgi:hypothetical protein
VQLLMTLAVPAEEVLFGIFTADSAQVPLTSRAQCGALGIGRFCPPSERQPPAPGATALSCRSLGGQNAHTGWPWMQIHGVTLEGAQHRQFQGHRDRTHQDRNRKRNPVGQFRP